MIEPKLAVLVSGTGSILEYMLNDGLPVALVIADRKCRGLAIAQERGIPCVLLERTDFTATFNRDAYTAETVEILKQHKITLIAMAGYNTLFGQAMFDAYGGFILNTHPSLLPAFKGHYAVRDALNAGVKITGCTIHIATIIMDEGPILAQEAVRVQEGDDVDTLWGRIKEAERPLYTQTVKERLLAQAS